MLMRKGAGMSPLLFSRRGHLLIIIHMGIFRRTHVDDNLASRLPEEEVLLEYGNNRQSYFDRVSILRATNSWIFSSAMWVSSFFNSIACI